MGQKTRVEAAKTTDMSAFKLSEACKALQGKNSRSDVRSATSRSGQHIAQGHAILPNSVLYCKLTGIRKQLDKT